MSRLVSCISKVQYRPLGVYVYLYRLDILFSKMLIQNCPKHKFDCAVLREAPLKKLHPLLGHCPNSDCTPPYSNGYSGALYYQADLSKCLLNFNFHCISAPNHPGKGSDSPNQANAPLNMDNSSQK